MKKFLIILFVIAVGQSFAQTDSLPKGNYLDELYQMAAKNYPILSQQSKYAEYHQIQQEIIKKQWLPTLDLNARMSWQNEVTEVPLDFSQIKVDLPLPGVTPNITGPEIPSVNKDQYKAWIEARQLIYDGGRIKKQAELSGFALQKDSLQNQMDFYQLKSRIKDLYFSALQLHQLTAITELGLEVLQARQKKMQSAFENGMLKAADTARIHLEIIKLQKQAIGLEYKISAIQGMLKVICGTDIQEIQEWNLPKAEFQFQNQNQRLETQLLKASKQQLQSQQYLIKSNRNPVLAGFSQLGYGNPALNMFSDEFEPYIIAGLQLNWKIIDWNESQKKRQAINIQQEILNDRLESFNKQINTQAIQYLQEYNQLVEQQQYNQQLLSAARLIRQAAETELDEGNITSADFIRELNNELQIQMEMQINSLNQLKAYLDYKEVFGNL